MSFRTNRQTRLVFPTGQTRNVAPSGIRERQKFLADRAKHNPADPNYAPPGKYNGWTNYDTWATYLMLTNDQRSYRWLGEWAKNWHKKVKGSRFIPDEAEFAVWKYIVPAAQGKGQARYWKAGPQYEIKPEGGVRFAGYEGDFVGEDRIDRSNVNYGEIVDRIMEDFPNPGPADIASGKSGFTSKDYTGIGTGSSGHTRDDYGDIGLR